MIYVTGDCHMDFQKFDKDFFPEQEEMTRNDYVIVCGDFGYWNKSPILDTILKTLSQKNFTLLFCDGNHGATRC